MDCDSILLFVFRESLVTAKWAELLVSLPPQLKRQDFGRKSEFKSRLLLGMKENNREKIYLFTNFILADILLDGRNSESPF